MNLSRGRKVLLLLSALPIYLTYHTVKHTMAIAAATGAHPVTGTIYVPEFDHDTVPEATRVMDTHTIAPYMKPGVRYTENGVEHTAIIQTDSPLYRVVGKKVSVLVFPDNRGVALPVEKSLRWESMKVNLRTILIIVALMVALWFSQIFLIFAVVPAAICVWALSAELADRESRRAVSYNTTEAPYRIVAETRELVYAATTDSKGRRTPAVYGNFHYVQFEYPADEYHTVRTSALTSEQQAMYKTIFFNAENPQYTAFEKPAAAEFWSRSVIVAVVAGFIAMLLVGLQILGNRVMKRQPRGSKP